jgi:hypothetical protein
MGGNQPGSYVNYALYRILGADYAVNVGRFDDTTLSVTVYDVGGRAAHRDIRMLTTPHSATRYTKRATRS